MNFQALFSRKTPKKAAKNEKNRLKIKKSKFYIFFVISYDMNRGGDRKIPLISFQNASSYCSLTVWLAPLLASFFRLTAYEGSDMLGGETNREG
ncbi:hypothetical protein CI793_00145 [Anoxybacillus ayderensis]|nr:hypothetical protein CI793_00145 [Anoxybacillus ayderensis]